MEIEHAIWLDGEDGFVECSNCGYISKETLDECPACVRSMRMTDEEFVEYIERLYDDED